MLDSDNEEEEKIDADDRGSTAKTDQKILQFESFSGVVIMVHIYHPVKKQYTQFFLGGE